MSGSEFDRRKVVLVINSLAVGGAERQIVELLRYLDRTRFDARLIVFEDGPLRAEVAQLGWPLTVLNIPVPRLGRWAYPETVWRLLRIVHALAVDFRVSRPAVIHSYLLSANFCSGFAARLTGQGLFIASRRSLGDLKNGQRFSRALENLVNMLANIVTINSKSVRQDIVVNECIDSSKLRLIYNGIETARYRREVDVAAKRRELGLSPQAPLIGSVANLSPIKGHADLLRALVLVRRQVPQAQVVLVGEDRGIQPSLEQLAYELGIREAVHFLGRRHDIPEILPIFDVQAQCSHSEAFSNAILEGGAAARPLVVTGVGGNLEAVQDGLTGLVVPPRDPQALAAALNQLIQNDTFATQLGAAMRQRVEKVFSMAAMVTATQLLYSENKRCM